MYYEHATAALNGKEIEYEVESLPLSDAKKTNEGYRIDR
jgi:hypothetical protein